METIRYQEDKKVNGYRSKTNWILVFVLLSFSALAQKKAHKFSKYEYQHGKLTPLRTCFDVKHYDITLKVDPEKNTFQVAIPSLLR
jgi:hypothetical protein